MISYVEFLSKTRVKKKNGEVFIYCIIRKKWLTSTPEEFVRQAGLLYLIDLGYSPSHITVERTIQVNKLSKRYDIVASDRNGHPVLLVECKAPHIPLNQEVLDQAGMYNLSLKGQYVWVTNGHENQVFFIDHKKMSFEQIDCLPLPTTRV